MSRRIPLSSETRRVLEASGLPWRLEEGKRHLQLIVGDRFAAIIPKQGKPDNYCGRADKNTLAQVRRVIKELGQIKQEL